MCVCWIPFYVVVCSIIWFVIQVITFFILCLAMKFIFNCVHFIEKCKDAYYCIPKALRGPQVFFCFFVQKMEDTPREETKRAPFFPRPCYFPGPEKEPATKKKQKVTPPEEKETRSFFFRGVPVPTLRWKDKKFQLEYQQRYFLLFAIFFAKDAIILI